MTAVRQEDGTLPLSAVDRNTARALELTADLRAFRRSRAGEAQSADLQLVDAGNGYYRLVNVRSGWCADVESGSAADGARVIQWLLGTGTNQQWQLDAL